MIVYELIGNTAWIDLADRPKPMRIGIYTTREKAAAEAESIKQKNSNWRMDWENFEINEVLVE